MRPHGAGAPAWITLFGGSELRLGELVFAAVFGSILVFAVGFPLFTRAMPAEELAPHESVDVSGLGPEASPS